MPPYPSPPADPDPQPDEPTEPPGEQHAGDIYTSASHTIQPGTSAAKKTRSAGTMKDRVN
jgi:hypothetical protein